MSLDVIFLVFFFNDTATTEIYTLSLHDALPISGELGDVHHPHLVVLERAVHAREIPVLHPPVRQETPALVRQRSEEHTSELQSRQYLVCRLLLEKKKKKFIVI